jgi:outer membrane protein OmpA-like peptidoglycan-associated protein
VGVLVLSLFGCSTHHAVILVPDPDGHIGKAEVATSGGTQLLEKAGDMTRVTDPAAPPSAVMTADANYIAVTFADALAVEPSQPEKFILFFETGTITLTSESSAEIATIIAAIKHRGAVSVSISGHTDAAGSALLNDKLARERSAFVSTLLQQKGINPDLMIVSSHGMGNPLVPNPAGVAELRNRRVEVIVH